MITLTFEDYTEAAGLAPYFNRPPVAPLLQVEEGTPAQPGPAGIVCCIYDLLSLMSQ